MSSHTVSEPGATTVPLATLNTLGELFITGEDLARVTEIKKELGLESLSMEEWEALDSQPEERRLQARLKGTRRDLLSPAGKAALEKLRTEQPEKYKLLWKLNSEQLQDTTIKKGCTALYNRIQNQELWHEGGGVNKRELYDRMTMQVRHLLTYAKENPNDQKTILGLLADMEGRCEGVITEVDALYGMYCLKKQEAKGIDAVLESKGYFTRQDIVNNYTNAHEELQDVHTNTVFKNLIAVQTGTPPLLETAYEKMPKYRSPAEAAAPGFLKTFPLQYAETLTKNMLELLLDPNTKETIDTGGGNFELLSEVILNEMLTSGHLGDLSPELDKMHSNLVKELQDPKNWSETGQLRKRFEKFGYTSTQEVLDAIKDISTADIINGKASAGKTLLRQCLLYPLCRTTLSQENVGNYLTDKGLLQQAPDIRSLLK